MRFYITKNEQTAIWILLLLALATSNFMLLGAYLFIAIALGYLFVRRRNIVVERAIILLFLFASSYFVVTTEPGTLLSGIKIFVLPLLWLVGNNMPDGKTPQGIFKVSMFLSIGMAVHGILNLLYNLVIGTNITSGKTYDIFSGALSTATGQLINFSMITAFISYLIFFETKKRIKITAVIVYLVMLYYDIQIGGRTFLVLSLISFLGAGLLYVFYVSKHRSIQKTLFILIAMVVVFALLVACFQNNLFGIKDIYENSYLYRRLEGGATFQNDTRLDRKLLYLQNMKHSLWGGQNIKNDIVGGYAHDLWLDVYDEAGIVSFILLGLYTIASIGRVIRLIRTDMEFQYKALFILYITVMMLQFFVEPILQGAPMLLYSYVMIDGMIARYCSSVKERRLQENVV